MFQKFSNILNKSPFFNSKQKLFLNFLFAIIIMQTKQKKLETVHLKKDKQSLEKKVF